MNQYALCAATAALCSLVSAQQILPLPLQVDTRSVQIDSGALDNPASQPSVVFSQQLQVAGAPWMMLAFDPLQTRLPGTSFIRLTSVLDGAVQRLDRAAMASWSAQSAAFNGDEVLVELVAGPKSVGSRVFVKAATLEIAANAAQIDSICGSVDDRLRSFDDRQGRLFNGCTGWMIAPDVMLTAGHCTSSVGQTSTIEFNVPLSTSGGSIVRSNPNDQYPFTVLDRLNAGIGSDWAVCRVGANSNTGLLPTQANGGQWYQLGPVPASPAGQTIRITGYGSTNPRDNLYLVQKTHTGPLSQVNANSLCYSTDTTGGNSGSPIVHENTGFAIGVHSHAGCSSTGGCNNGTRIDRADLQAAIAAASVTLATFETYGMGCPQPPSVYELFTTGADVWGQSFLLSSNGGTTAWTVSACTSNCFDSGFSNNLNLGDDQLATGLALGFSVSLPGVGAINSIAVDSNGWIGLGTGFTGSDFSETVAEFLADAPRLAVFWDDLNPSSGGGVYFDTVPGRAIVTWDAVPEFSNTGANTMQAQFFANGDIILSYGAGSAADGLVGYTVGGGAVDPGSRDLDASLPISLGSGGAPLQLDATAFHVLGSNAAYELSSLPAGTLVAAMHIGVSQTALPLDLIGMEGCSLLASVELALPMTMAGGVAGLSIPTPNDAGLVGAELFTQGLVIAPGVNALGVASSNGGQARIGF